MTREQAKSKIKMSVTVNKDYIKSLEKADEVINQIYDELEAQVIEFNKVVEETHFQNEQEYKAQLKAKDEEIAKYQMAIDKQSKRAETLKQLSLDKDNEIATAKMRHKLEHDRYLITEAIIKEKDEEIERLKVELKRDLNEPLKSITINQMGGGKDEY